MEGWNWRHLNRTNESQICGKTICIAQTYTCIHSFIYSFARSLARSFMCCVGLCQIHLGIKLKCSRTKINCADAKHSNKTDSIKYSFPLRHHVKLFTRAPHLQYFHWFVGFIRSNQSDMHNTYIRQPKVFHWTFRWTSDGDEPRTLRAWWSIAGMECNCLCPIVRKPHGISYNWNFWSYKINGPPADRFVWLVSQWD